MNRAQRRAAARTKTPQATGLPKRQSRPGITPMAPLWFSNAPWAGTGYGTQTKQVVERMRDDGHAIAISSNYGLQAMQTVWEGIPIYPMGFEAYSNDVAGANFHDWARKNPDLVPHLFVLFDAWVLKGKHWDELPVSIWTMVDHMPVPPDVMRVLSKPNITPIAVTEWGQGEIIRQGREDARYIPMAIDTGLYTPTMEYDGQPGWQLMGFDSGDYHITMICNANKGVLPARKAWGENLLAWSIFASRHDDARLYIHTERHGNVGGIQMDPLFKAVGLKEHQYRVVNQYANFIGIPNEAMAVLYSNADVLLAATMGEGFGLTVLEAGACGTPAIVNNFSAQPELVSEDSWLTEGQPWWDPAQFAWFNTPNVMSIVACLEESYARGKGRSTKQIEHAAKYDADLVWDQYWRPYLKELADGGPTGQASLTAATVVGSDNWAIGPADSDPLLTIYIPAYRRREVAALLDSIAAQADGRVEVLVADDDPTGMAKAPTMNAAWRGGVRVEYARNPKRLGGEANILRGYEQGKAPWVWIVGDDDRILPGAIDHILGILAETTADRLILHSERSPRPQVDFAGDSLADVAGLEPGLPIAATLITANVVRRSALDMNAARAHFGTQYSHSWALTGCKRVRVVAKPCIEVGNQHGGEFMAEAGYEGNVAEVWDELLRKGFGITPTPEHFAWNYASVG